MTLPWRSKPPTYLGIFLCEVLLRFAYCKLYIRQILYDDNAQEASKTVLQMATMTIVHALRQCHTPAPPHVYI